MIRKPLEQSEFLSALDFVRADIDNLRAYFEHGAINPTPAILDRAMKLRGSIDSFCGLVGVPQRETEAVFTEISSAKEPIQSAILNEVLNVKELLAKQGLSNIAGPKSEIATLKEQLATSLAGLEQRIINNMEYAQKVQIEEYSEKMISQFTNLARPNQTAMTAEILSEISEFREEATKQIASVETRIVETLNEKKEEIVNCKTADNVSNCECSVKENVAQSLVLAKTSMQVLRAISKQLIGIYQSEKKTLENIEKSIENGFMHSQTVAEEDTSLAEGFAQLKEELATLSGIINFEEFDTIQDKDQALGMVDSYSNAQFEPQGLLETAKELEALATELFELEKEQEKGEE